MAEIVRFARLSACAALALSVSCPLWGDIPPAGASIEACGTSASLVVPGSVDVDCAYSQRVNGIPGPVTFSLASSASVSLVAGLGATVAVSADEAPVAGSQGTSGLARIEASAAFSYWFEIIGPPGVPVPVFLDATVPAGFGNSLPPVWDGVCAEGTPDFGYYVACVTLSVIGLDYEYLPGMGLYEGGPGPLPFCTVLVCFSPTVLLVPDSPYFVSGNVYALASGGVSNGGGPSGTETAFAGMNVILPETDGYRVEFSPNLATPEPASAVLLATVVSAFGIIRWRAGRTRRNRPQNRAALL